MNQWPRISVELDMKTIPFSFSWEEEKMVILVPEVNFNRTRTQLVAAVADVNYGTQRPFTVSSIIVTKNKREEI